MSQTEPKPRTSETDPKLRHEFVGMMFAITVGEIGLQTAALVQAKHWIHYLPAYSHLFLATFVVAASWVGWSKSVSPGARQDVDEPFEWAFLVLLLDMAMVVTYFILVRTVDFSEPRRRIDSASVVAGWHVLIFALYILWDFVTKVLMYERKPSVGWFRGWFGGDAGMRKERIARIVRTAPTAICLLISWELWRVFDRANDEHRLTADFALLSVVLLFRALKRLLPAIWQSRADLAKPRRLGFRISWTVACVVGLGYGTWMTVWSRPLPLPDSIIQELRTPIHE